MTAFAIDDTDLAYLGESGVDAEDVAAYLSSMQSASRLLSTPLGVRVSRPGQS